METGGIDNTESQAQTSTTTVSGSSEIMGKDDFLKLLCVQLKHQNPLNPMEGQEFSAHLAQFSQVEQLQNMSGYLSQSNELNLRLTQAITNTLSTTLVGKQAKVAGNMVLFNKDQTPQVSFKLGSYADKVKITITDESGNQIRVLTYSGLGAGEHTFFWDGKDKLGNDLKEGKYYFEVTARNGESQSVLATPLMIGSINGVRFTETGSYLLINNQEAPFSSVLEILGQTNDNT